MGWVRLRDSLDVGGLFGLVSKLTLWVGVGDGGDGDGDGDIRLLSDTVVEI